LQALSGTTHFRKPKPVTDEVLNTVIVLGTEARLDPLAGKRFEIWETD
jgi:arsenate-mycothiol transferase